MFSVKIGRAHMAAATATIAMAFMSVPQANAQSVVIRSTGPSASQYPQGKKLPANARVTLKASDQVTVLDKAGTRRLSGPGTFTLDGKVVRDQSASRRVASFMSNGAARRSRTGAVRGAGTSGPSAPRSPNLWYVDISKGGTYCVANPEEVVLWRPQRVGALAGTIEQVGGASAVIDWANGNPLKAWPTSELPVVDGASYVVTTANGTTTRITTRIVEPPADDLAASAELLMTNECTGQFDLMVDTLEDSAKVASVG